MAWARGVFSGRGARCQIQGYPDQLDIVDVETEGGAGEAVKSVLCDTCGFHEPCDRIIDRAAEQLEHFQRAEFSLFASSGLVFVLFALIAYLFGNFLTLFGGRP